MITVTEKAAAKACKLAERDGQPAILRVGVRGGGCSGLSYFIDFDANGPQENDKVLEVHGLTVICDPKSLEFIEGTTLDYDTNLLSGGFRFSNPKAKRSCSCGESFSV